MESALQAADKREGASITQLIAEDRKLWNPLLLERVSDNAEETSCGWKLVRPSAIYDITKTHTKRKKIAAALDTTNSSNTLYQHSKDERNLEKRQYMSGELDENYSYVYKGGLSDRADTSTLQQTSVSAHHLSRPRKHVQTVMLQPSHTTEASAHALASCRAELSRIVSLQLKPELLVEQLIIENRLRAMSLSAFPSLDSIDSRFGRGERTYSHSTPSLPNTHVNYLSPRHRQYRGRDRNSKHKPPPPRLDAKPLPHMEWCDSLSSHRGSSEYLHQPVGPLPQLRVSHQQSALHLRDQTSLYNTHGRQTKNPSNNPRAHPHTTNTSTDHLSSPRYRLPVVAPKLQSSDAARGREVKGGRHLNNLLYKPDRLSDGKGQHKLNLTTGSSFYYPHVSYANSKSMKFK